MKRRPRTQPDPDRIVVVPAPGAGAVVLAKSGDGVRVEGDWAAGPEGSRPPAVSVALLETGHVICRTFDLPEAEPAQLETALRLQFDTQQLGALPAWRTACMVLPTPAPGGRVGLSLEWPETHAPPSTPRDLPPDGDPVFASDAACLATLLERGAQGPLVSVAHDRACITFAFRSGRGAVIRCARLAASEWPACAETAVLESALRAGADATSMRALLAGLREALAAAEGGAFGCTAADRAALAGHVEGAGDADWWRSMGPAVAVALAWFGPMRPLVCLRARPAGERPTRVGEFLNRIAEPVMLTRLVVAALLTLALAPPLVTGARLLLLRWKVGDLPARESAIQAHRQRLAMYGQLQQRAWPMGKLLGDLACVTPEGVDWEDVSLAQDRNVTIRGSARPQDGLSGTEVILKMERQVRDSRIFDKVQKKWDAPDSKGSVAFTMSAAVVRPTLRPSYPAAQDFGRKTLAERRYGPEKAEQHDDEAPSEPPPASSLPTRAPQAITPSPLRRSPPRQPSPRASAPRRSPRTSPPASRAAPRPRRSRMATANRPRRPQVTRPQATRRPRARAAPGAARALARARGLRDEANARRVPATSSSRRPRRSATRTSRR